MPKIELNKDDSLEKALKRFKSKVRREGIIDEMKKREYYEKPSQRRRKDLEKAIRREKRRAWMKDK